MTEASCGPQRALRPPIREVTPTGILRWMRLGFRDLGRAGWPSLAHGLIVTAISLVIIGITFLFWPLLPGAVSGFLVVGPVLAAGLYALSYRVEQGEPARFRDAVNAWRCGSRCLFRFGLLLIGIGTVWVLLSVVLFYFFVHAEIAGPTDFLRYVVVQNDGIFLLWTILAGLVAAVTFAITVVSVPMLVDRDVTTPQALRTSIRAVARNPVTMTAWALFILLAAGFSVATMMLGFIVLYPVMGHASWHVYRDVVDTSGIPLRKRAG